MTGEIAAISTAILWSFTAQFFTMAGRRTGSLTVNLLRLPMGLFLLLATHLFLGGSFFISPANALHLSLSGILGLALGDAFLFEAFVVATPRIALLIFTLSPAMTALMAYFTLGETIRLPALIGIALTLTGVAWALSGNETAPDDVGIRRTSLTLKGILLSLGGAAGQSVGLVLAKPALTAGVDALYATIIRMASATAAMLVYSLIIHSHGGNNFRLRNRKALIPLAAGTICGPYLGVWLSQVSIKHTGTGIAATIMATVPILILPIAHYCDGERITRRAVIGTIASVAGVAILFFRSP